MNFRDRIPFALTCVLVLSLVVSCVQFSARRPPVRPEPIRISEVSNVGDPARRASTRLLLTGLDYEIDQSPDRAIGRYERAIQVDPTNPYAYLVIARHRVEYGDPAGALAFLDKAESLFRARGEISPTVAVNLLGLRGRALYDEGDVERGTELLARASDQAPAVWRDGHLSAYELR